VEFDVDALAAHKINQGFMVCDNVLKDLLWVASDTMIIMS
jgi:hypothetical protein